MWGRVIRQVARTRLPHAVACGARRGVATVVRTQHMPAARPAFLQGLYAQRFVRCFASGDYPDHLVIKMPSLSPTMSAGTIQSWTVKPGDEVAAGDQLGEIETDKAVMSFDATEDGYIAKLLVEEGTSDVPVGKPVLVMVDNEEDVGKFADFVPDESATPAPAKKKEEKPAKKEEPKKSEPAQKAAPAPSTPAPKSGDRIFVSPLAKRLAAEASISLEQLTGTGPRGRITKADVEAYQAAGPSTSASATQAAPVSGDFTDLNLSNMRKTIARRLFESKSTVPHYYLTVDVRVDEVLALRKQFNDKANGEYKLSVNDFVIKASALALKKVPAVNSSWMDTFIRQHNTADISIAVSTPNGLITPIITSAESSGLVDISNRMKDLATRARDNKLAPHEFQGGTFSISNLGMFGINSFSAIINPPQSCILAVGTSEKQVVPDAKSENGLGVATVMSVTLSCDHRVVDGATGAQWLQAFKSYMENPFAMLL